MQTPQFGKTITKLEPRIEVTPSGAKRTVYRRTVFHKDHPEYQNEFDKMIAAYDANRSKPLNLIPKGS